MGAITAGFHHVSLVARDADTVERFYGEILGLRLLSREGDGRRTELLFDHGSGEGGLIAVDANPGMRKGRWGVGGVHHVALQTSDEATQLQWKRRLIDAGVPVSGPYDRGWFHSIYFTDPDGQVLEIATVGPGYEIDEPIDRLGGELRMPAASQLRGGRDEAAIAAAIHPDPVPEITSAMRLQGIHHVTGITGDVQRADAFYRDALGLRLVKRSVNQDDPATPHWFWARYDGMAVAPHSSYTLFGWPRSDYFARTGHGQTHHFAFRAGGDDDLEEWREQLRRAGARPSAVTERPHWRSIYFRAPDDQVVELATDFTPMTGDTVRERSRGLEPELDAVERALIDVMTGGR